jgi:hypothetical protein
MMGFALFGVWRWKLPESSEGGAGEVARGIGSLLVAAVTVFAVGAAGRTALTPGEPQAAVATIVTVGTQIPTGDAWTENLSNPAAWRGGQYLGDRRGRRASPNSAWPEPDDEPKPERRGFEGGAYRTMCVRLCDGYFFPVSFSTTPERFAHDAAACASSCTAPARLFVYRNPGAEPEQMVDLEGRPYTALKSAFLFRTSYDAACTCKPHPWEKEALARHRAYAEAQKKGQGARTVARTIRSEPKPGSELQADAGPRLHRRPDGAMLLGAETKKEPQRDSGRRSTGSSSRRGDWQQRAFSGN